MGNNFSMQKQALGCAIWLATTQVFALSLGPTQGPVYVGRPLDVLVQTGVEAAEAAAGLCLEAEVLYGESRIAASAVTVAIHQLGADGQGFLRVRVAEAVSEPFVTLMLRAGCQQVYKRNYTLLADPEPATQGATGTSSVASGSAYPVPVAARPAAPKTTSAVAPARATAKSRSAPAGNGQTRGAVQNLVPETPIRLSAPVARPAGVAPLRSKIRTGAVVPVAEMLTSAKSVASPPPPVSAVANTGPRLQLDPVDVSPTQGPASPSAPDAVPQIPEAATSAANGAAAPITADPALLQELASLRAEQERMRLTVESLNAQLKRESSPGVPSVWWAAGAALVAAAAGGVYWRRRRTPAGPSQSASSGHDANPWWESQLPSIPVVGTAPAVEASSATPTDLGAAVGASSVSGPDSQPWHPDAGVSGMEVREAGESLFREVPIADLNLLALQGLWDRVDMCESLGQYGEAMELLRSFTTDNPRASEAPYLRWLTLARHQGGRDAQTLAQAVYEHHFQRLVPSVLPQTDLTVDPMLLAELTAVWPQPAARDLLLNVLSSQPGDPATALVSRSVAAFDDALFLLRTWDVLQTLSVQNLTPAVAPDLSLDFPSVTTAMTEGLSPAMPAPALAPSQAGDNSLDFEFLDWDGPVSAPTAPGAEPSSDGPRGDTRQGS